MLPHNSPASNLHAGELFYPQRQIAKTISAIDIATPTIANASGQVIDSPPAAALVAASRTRRSLTTIKCHRSTPRIPLAPVLPYTHRALNKLKSNHLERGFVYYSLSNEPELPESCSTARSTCKFGLQVRHHEAWRRGRSSSLSPLQ